MTHRQRFIVRMDRPLHGRVMRKALKHCLELHKGEWVGCDHDMYIGSGVEEVPALVAARYFSSEGGDVPLSIWTSDSDKLAAFR